MKPVNNEIRAYNANEVITRQGNREAWMYDVYSGKVGVFLNYGTPAKKLLTTLEQEQFFGEMGLLSGEPRSATIVALENGTKVQIIRQEGFEQYLKENPGRLLQIMQQTSRRLRTLTRDYMEACKTASDIVNADPEGAAERAALRARQKRFAEVYASVKQQVEQG